jgi:hypothetical protein
MRFEKKSASEFGGYHKRAKKNKHEQDICINKQTAQNSSDKGQRLCDAISARVTAEFMVHITLTTSQFNNLCDVR